MHYKIESKRRLIAIGIRIINAGLIMHRQLFILFRIRKGEGTIQKGVEQILGYPVSFLYEHPFLWSESIHPIDQSKIKQSIDSSSNGIKFDVEYQIKDAKGCWLWFRDLSIDRHQEKNETIIDGIAFDITHSKANGVISLRK